jgi:hypothetical protein
VVRGKVLWLCLDPEGSTFLIPSVHLTGGIAPGLGSLPDMFIVAFDTASPSSHHPKGVTEYLHLLRQKRLWLSQTR